MREQAKGIGKGTLGRCLALQLLDLLVGEREAGEQA
jgi:hypothetical protein